MRPERKNKGIYSECKFCCSGCSAECSVYIPNKSTSTNKKKPDSCIFGIFSLATNETIAVWRKYKVS